MDATFKNAFEFKVIYVFTIDDEMPKSCIYAGFRHWFYKMALLWLYL